MRRSAAGVSQTKFNFMKTEISVQYLTLKQLVFMMTL